MTNVQIKFQLNGRGSAMSADCALVEAQTNFLVFKVDGMTANSVPYGCIETLKINDVEVKDLSQAGIAAVLLDESDEGSGSTSGSTSGEG
jgi:hypothetical protein